MQLNQERRLSRLCQNALFNHRAFDIIVLNNNVLFENFDRVKLVSAFSLSQHDLPEGSLAENHQEVEIRCTNDVFLSHVVGHIFVRYHRNFLGDRRFAHLDLQLGEISAVVGHGHIIEFSFFGSQKFKPPIALN